MAIIAEQTYGGFGAAYGRMVEEAEAAGAHGVIRAGTAVQVVVGPEADTIASDIEDLM